MKGILFKPNLVKQIVTQGPMPDEITGPYKCVTRRQGALKRQPYFNGKTWVWPYKKDFIITNNWIDMYKEILSRCRYQVNDDVYLKETWLADWHGFLGYMADYDLETKRNIMTGASVDVKLGIEKGSYILKSAMFMPEKYSRVFFTVPTISIVRLCDIDEKEAWREGFETVAGFFDAWYKINRQKVDITQAMDMAKNTTMLETLTQPLTDEQKILSQLVFRIGLWTTEKK